MFPRRCLPVFAYRITCPPSILGREISSLAYPITSALAGKFWGRGGLFRGGLSSLTRITVTLSIKGFKSAERIGLVLLLCPGVELVLFADKCELSRCGSGNRTMADKAAAVCTDEAAEGEERKEGRRSESGFGRPGP